jgi:signal transduction histidine kinase/DNA-binding response OmpR family regulator/ligand-binding sensor domain-containing protein
MQKSTISYNNDFLNSVLEIPAITIFKDRKGSIWVVSIEKIYKLEFDVKGSISHIYTVPQKEILYRFTCISEIDNEIWVGNDGAVYKIIESQEGNLNLELVSTHLSISSNLFISSILKKDNTIWMATEGGLFRYNDINLPPVHYQHNVLNRYSISQDMVTDLNIISGSIIAGTLRGLNIYNPVTDGFEHITHNSAAESLNSDFINCLLTDGDNLWIGTESGGINKMTLRKLAVKNYTHSNSDKGSISPNPVNAILESRNGNLWVGSVESGLNLMKKGETSFTHYMAGPGLLSHNTVSVLEEDNAGNLWIGTWGGAISILDENKLPAVSYKYINPNSSFIGILKYDPVNNGMWIGTNRAIYWYDMQNNSLESPLPDNMNQNIWGTLGSAIDKKNRLWLGCSEGLIQIDLNAYDKPAKKFAARFVSLNEQEVNKLFLKNVTCIFQTRGNTIWVGSNGYGICKIDEIDGKYVSRTYTTVQGLVNNAVFGILEDEQGLLWISTGQGVSSFNPQTERFVNYTKDDGLANHQFYWNAFFKSPVSKNLYFGSMTGLTELQGSSRYASEKQRGVTFTKLQILNQTVWYNKDNYIKEDISYAKRLDLHEQDKSFSIEFSALDYDNPSTVAYSYRLLGFDDRWVDVPANRRFVSYTNLSPGAYRLQVRCMDKASDWSEKITELEIEIHPFFYKTVWFISLCIILLLVLGIQLYKWRINSLKKQREILHVKVEERTRVLKEQKKLLEEQAVELKLQNTILVDQNEKISYQRKQLIEMSKKVQEAMTDRMSFFTNITHEFRTPITLIIGPIEKALKLSTNPKVVEQLQYVSRNSKHLLSLVNQLMDFRKVESDSMSVNPTAGNLINFLDELLIPFESFANERGIKIRRAYRMPQPRIMFDEEAIRKLITNLLANSIKFTPDNGSVTLYVSSITGNNGEDKLYICVQDSGIGIKEEDLNRIFNRFYQSDSRTKYPVYGQSGTGIGLYLCKNIVSLLEGSIVAGNNHSKGASFRILLPFTPATTGEQQPVSENYMLPITDNAESLPVTEQNGQQLTILVVEDNMDMRKYICSILSDCYEVVEAENGAEALKILETESIDFIISDLMMPLMDGLELSQKVKSDLSTSHIPFLMLTAKTSIETRIGSYKMGADEFLTKPFDEELLLTRINNILEIRKLYQRKFSLYMNVEELNIAEDSNDEKFLKKAMEIVKENYTDTEYDVSDFVNDMGVSKSLLNKKMQMLTGEPPSHFIRDFRLSIARELILKSKGDKTISEIAYEVGFNDPKYFTRCFTKHFGIAPSAISKDADYNIRKET